MDEQNSLARRLGTRDAVFIGLGSMIGAGVFVAFAPAARAAGAWLPAGLALAAVVAYCNATSSARLAALYPASGGTYVYGRERLGEFWGQLAGWGFVVGKTASCAAMALTVVTYAAPGLGQPWRGLSAVGVVAALTGLNYRGVQRSAFATRLIVSITLTILTLAVAAMLFGGTMRAGASGPSVVPGVGGVLEAAGLLFFAFAGYARIATLGEEVRDPARTIPRAVPIALGLALVVYAVLGFVLLYQLGPDLLGRSPDPIAEGVERSSWSWLTPAVRVGAVLAAVGSLLALVLGVSRTTLAMARDGHLPRYLTAVHPRFGVPHRAELTVGVVVALLASTVDLRGAIGFSSFAVLAYYAVANASALTLRPGSRVIAVVGLLGCVVLAFSLPAVSVLAGSGVLALGALGYAIRRRFATNVR
ncbi:APC family permease [Amycolatopsis regifaucium]|uniref:Transporter n=1 Tax=Amycolatopsis regifaucium TaxID=546365 RepID=A0A154MJC0_9PSEU|nr:amino acid permease [Amycolatopsis regifaucium]KZB84406.1 transporter [Amycolatopsis regifaucium]OKA10869.1 transporter [Amycolatopsis regifaucium]SFI20412.1 amino acid/polyamine/organocation transporter, APC superfamily [Amycolatopsis regifaucium]